MAARSLTSMMDKFMDATIPCKTDIAAFITATGIDNNAISLNKPIPSTENQNKKY